MKLFPSILFLGLSFLLSCTTKVDGLYVSEAFNVETLKRSNILIGGVAIPGTEYSDETSSGYGNILSARISDERKEYKTIPYGEFVRGLGKKGVKEVMDEFRATGSLKPETAKKLAEKFKDARFIALTRIEGNHVNHFTRTDTPTERKDSRGRVYTQPGQTHLSTERKVTALLTIIDLQKAGPAFSGTVTKSDSNTISYEADRGRSFVSININSNSQTTPNAPAAPDTRDVLGKIYAGFVDNFPEED